MNIWNELGIRRLGGPIHRNGTNTFFSRSIEATTIIRVIISSTLSLDPNIMIGSRAAFDHADIDYSNCW